MQTPTRRTVLAGAAASLAATIAPHRVSATTAGTLTAGRFTATTLSDGHLTLPTAMIAPGADTDQRAKALAAAGQTDALYRSPLNVTLIRSDKENILIDVGSGPHFMASAGKLEAALAETGLDPDAITHVFFTHAHPDHLWGTVNDFDELTFPSASFHIAEAEWNFWMADDVLTHLPEDRHAFAIGAKRNLDAIKDRITTFKPGAELLPGIQAIDTAGHTPGHVSFDVGDARTRIAVLGDALTHPVISFEHPTWRMSMDHEPDKAVATRKRLLDRLAADGHALIGYHLPDPGIGRVQRKGAGFTFQAVA